MASSRARSDGLFRLTKVGLWFLVFALVVAVAATNTGNNGLFLVLAAMLATLLASALMAGRNVRGLEVALTAHGEVFANRPARLGVEIRNRGWLPRWLLVAAVDRRDVEPPAPRVPADAADAPASFLAAYVAPGGTASGQLELTARRRGRRRIRRVHLSSLFPLGFFRKGRRYPADLEILVYPELLAVPPPSPEQLGQAGDRSVRRAGWGHDLFGLRDFRYGDDPRSIHWKQSARTGNLTFKQRQAEENRRLLILLDNAAGPREAGPREAAAFERLVSEAATAALDYLEQGYEVALVTREGRLPFAAGPRQRQAILETLALIEVRDAAAPLAPPAGAPCLRLALDSERSAA